MNRFCTIAVIALASGLLAHAAQADDTGNTERHLTVAYGDLDLNKEAGAQALIARLKSAGQQVCGETPDSRDIKNRARYQACVKAAVDDAVARLATPMVAASYGLPPLSQTATVK